MWVMAWVLAWAWVWARVWVWVVLLDDDDCTYLDPAAAETSHKDTRDTLLGSSYMRPSSQTALDGTHR